MPKEYIDRTEAESAALKRVVDAIRSFPRGSYVEIDSMDATVTVWRRTSPCSAVMAGPAVRIGRKKIEI